MRAEVLELALDIMSEMFGGDESQRRELIGKCLGLAAKKMPSLNSESSPSEQYEIETTFDINLPDGVERFNIVSVGVSTGVIYMVFSSKHGLVASHLGGNCEERRG